MNDSHILEFLFTMEVIEVYKEKNHEVYYWKFFDDNEFHGAFMSLQTCMSNYENILLKDSEIKVPVPGKDAVCPVVQSSQSGNNVIFVDFFKRKRSI